MARPGVSNTRSLCSVKAAKATMNLDSVPNDAAGDVRGDIAKVDIIFD